MEREKDAALGLPERPDAVRAPLKAGRAGYRKGWHGAIPIVRKGADGREMVLSR